MRACACISDYMHAARARQVRAAVSLVHGEQYAPYSGFQSLRFEIYPRSTSLGKPFAPCYFQFNITNREVTLSQTNIVPTSWLHYLSISFKLKRAGREVVSFHFSIWRLYCNVPINIRDRRVESVRMQYATHSSTASSLINWTQSNIPWNFLENCQGSYDWGAKLIRKRLHRLIRRANIFRAAVFIFQPRNHGDLCVLECSLLRHSRFVPFCLWCSYLFYSNLLSSLASTCTPNSQLPILSALNSILVCRK